MSESILFSTYLHDLMNAQRVSADQLQQGLNCRTSMLIQSWLGGRSRPQLWVLPRIASILKADPVEMHVGWIIDQSPEMEGVLRTEVLDPRGSKFPHSTDLTLRMPKQPRRVSLW
jgi:hypothetical protein